MKYLILLLTPVIVGGLGCGTTDCRAGVQCCSESTCSNNPNDNLYPSYRGTDLNNYLAIHFQSRGQ